MDTELHLRLARVRARELRTAADHHRAARALRAATAARTLHTVRDLHPAPASNTWESRLGWALVEAGLHLVQRRVAQG